MAQTVKNLSAMRETQVRSLGWEDPLEKEMATHSSNAWRVAMDRGAWWATVHGVAESDTTEQLSHTHTHTHVQLSCFAVQLKHCKSTDFS